MSVEAFESYIGQILDDDTGLYYYGARYYDPQLARFIQPDSIVPEPGNSQALNRYSYCVNNPLKYTDPSGHAYVPFSSPSWGSSGSWGVSAISGGYYSSSYDVMSFNSSSVLGSSRSSSSYSYSWSMGSLTTTYSQRSYFPSYSSPLAGGIYSHYDYGLPNYMSSISRSLSSKHISSSWTMSSLTGIRDIPYRPERPWLEHLSEKDFYTEMGERRREIKRCRWGPMSIGWRDSIYYQGYRNNTLYYFSGQMLKGSELNYYVVGMGYRRWFGEGGYSLGIQNMFQFKIANMAVDAMLYPIPRFRKSPEDRYAQPTPGELAMFERGFMEFPNDDLFKRR